MAPISEPLERLYCAVDEVKTATVDELRSSLLAVLDCVTDVTEAHWLVDTVKLEAKLNAPQV